MNNSAQKSMVFSTLSLCTAYYVLSSRLALNSHLQFVGVASYSLAHRPINSGLANNMGYHKLLLPIDMETHFVIPNLVPVECVAG